MKTVCQQDMCAGCKACIDICPKSAIDIKDEISAYNAIIDEEKCINCNACHKVCPNVNPSFFLKTMEYKQGWANDILVRKESSSGGIATALMIDFIFALCCASPYACTTYPRRISSVLLHGMHLAWTRRAPTTEPARPMVQSISKKIA